jgi:serine-type D-Ala-D-Ala carboxypeptidase (penicillin-binding protein 5/6)
MSGSPFIPPPRRGRRRRSRWGRATAFVVSAAVVPIAITLALAIQAGTVLSKATHSAGTPRHSPASHARAIAGPLAPSGFPLGRPELPLHLGPAPADPMQLGFAHPPRAGIVVNLDTGAVLWQLHPRQRLRIASLTKMMTALVAAKSTTPASRVLITRQAEDMPGSKVGLLPLGRRVNVEPVLYGLLLPSGNDAAVALAQHVAGTVPSFVKEVNEAAARLGLGCTRYSSPSGYYDAGNFSCAADLAELAHDDLAQPRIAAIARTANAVLRFPVKGHKLFLTNNNPLLLYGYPDTTGLKTGYTEAAGPCLVATAQRDGVRLAVVLLDSMAPGTQAAALLDAAFTHVYHQPPMPHPPIPAGV